LDDNAPYTAYENLFLGLPFIASNTKSITPLVAPEDRARVLFATDPESVAAAMKRAQQGVTPAKGVFTIETAEQSWGAFYKLLDNRKCP
jgi:hypothetical protein